MATPEPVVPQYQEISEITFEMPQFEMPQFDFGMQQQAMWGPPPMAQFGMPQWNAPMNFNLF